jgi:hypothetical protein
MVNVARGETELRIGDKAYAVRMSMGALAEMASALGVKSLPELNDRILQFNLADMPLIISAALKGNGHDVPMQAINGMDWKDYFEHVIPAFFRAQGDPGRVGDGKDDGTVSPELARVAGALAGDLDDFTEADTRPLRRQKA